jgi:hypothetical protein
MMLSISFFTVYNRFDVKYLVVKAIPLQAWTGPEVSSSLWLPDFKTVSI